MIVTATVLNKAKNETVKIPFLVRFQHSPVDHTSKKAKRRICLAEVNILTPVELIPGESRKFSSRVTGEQYATVLARGKCTCTEKDTYCRAFGRVVSLERAVRSLITGKADEFMNTAALAGCPFEFNAATFKDFMKQLAEAHPHGMEHAKSLLNSDYKTTKKSCSKKKCCDCCDCCDCYKCGE